MDSLEARLQFIQVLKTLPKTLNLSKNQYSGTNTVTPTRTANNENLQDPIRFYMQYYTEHYEDFQQCLIDTMSKMDPLDRLYIMIYYSKIIHELYIKSKTVPSNNNNINKDNILYDIIIPNVHIICHLVCPTGDMKAFTNLPYCIEFYHDLDTLFINELNSTEIGNIHNDILKKELNVVQEYLSNLNLDKIGLLQSFQQNGTLTFEQAIDSNSASGDNGYSTAVQIVLNRMEMDRDRHKKLKEQNWQVSRAVTVDNTNQDNASNTRSIITVPINEMLVTTEFDQLWENTMPFNSTDAHFAGDIQKIAIESYGQY